MVTRLNPYVSFRDTAREAMEFYRTVFGGELVLSTFAEAGMPVVPGEGDRIMHGMLETPGGLVLMGADTPSSMEHTPAAPSRSRSAATTSASCGATGTRCPTAAR